MNTKNLEWDKKQNKTEAALLKDKQYGKWEEGFFKKIAG